MAEKEEYSPDWGDSKQVVAGEYIWTVYIKSCSFKESVSNGESKPYMLIGAIVEDPPDGPEEPMNGVDFDFRIYLNPKSAWKCIWFLKKFDYPLQYLANESKPVLKRQEIMGLHGKVLVKVEAGETGYLNFYVNGFDHVGGVELEEKRAKKNNQQAPADATGTIEPPENVIDLEADVPKTPNLESNVEAANAALDALDDL